MMIIGMKETRQLCIDNLDFQKKVYSHPEDWFNEHQNNYH